LYSFSTFTVDVNLTDGAQHRLALYMLDWDVYLGGRSEQIDVLDAATGQMLDSRSVTNFANGKYLVWNVTGHVQFRFTMTGASGNTCVLSGLFFG
jgi:hypothetical protein